MKKTKLIPFVAMAGLVASSLPLGLVTSCKSNDNEKSDIAINLTGAVASSYAVDTQSISSTNGTLNFTIVRTASSNDANAAYAVGIVSMSANSVSNDAIAFAPFTDYQFNFKDADSYSNIIVTVSQAKTQELLNSGATLNVQLSQSNMNDASFVSVYCNNYDAQITYDNPEYDANGNLVIDHIKVINSENDTTYSGVNAYCFVGSSLKVAFDNGYITQNWSEDGTYQYVTVDRNFMRYYGYNITFCLTPTIEGNTTYDEKVALNDVTIDSACSTTLSLAYNNAQGQTIYTDSLENRVSYWSGSNLGDTEMLTVVPYNGATGNGKVTNVWLKETSTDRYLEPFVEYFPFCDDNGSTKVILGSGVTYDDITVEGTVSDAAVNNQYSLSFDTSLQNMSESAAASFVHSVGEKRVVLTAANSNEAGVLASSNAVALVTTLSKYAVSTCNMQLQQNIASERADALQLVLNYKDGSSQLLSIDNTKYTCQAISQDQNSSETQDSVYSIQFAANAISDAINSAGLTLAQVANIQSIDAQLSIVSNN